ncbi:MAG: nucleotidyltransferase domain-containing protein [Chloroflexi bacterium]|nr:nucleotidyltransferase domain-containing protein [Chloroflexota bacterium]
MNSKLPPEVAEALQDLRRELATIYGSRLRGLLLYGSYARGKARAEDSDVDLLIVLEGPVRPGEELARLSWVLSQICLDHDLLISAYPVPETWLVERQSPLFLNVRKEGVRV